MTAAAAPAEQRPPTRRALGEIARLFLTLGLISFGGPAAHIAMMEDEVVRRRRWLTREAFLDYLGATNLIPGPNSTELAIHIGRVRGGWPGLVVAGACFILPATLIVAALAAAYVRYGALPAASGVLRGVKPVVIAVVVQALWGLARSAVRSRRLAALGAGAVLAAALGVHELVVLAAAAVVGMLLLLLARPTGAGWHRSAAVSAMPMAMPVAMQAAAASGGAAAAGVSLWPLFGVFAKTGALLFGSGYVLLAFLRADLVERLHWLTERQLLDAVAVGQVTPGPLFTTATFIGYVLAGGAGAATATVGIFLPAFIFVAISGPLVPRLRASPLAGAALDGINAASLALMAVVSWQLARAAVVDLPTAGLALASAVLLLRYRVNSAWLVAGGAALGLLLWRQSAG